MEYEDHATICSDCGATLVERRGLFMSPAELEAAGRLPARREAEVTECDTTSLEYNPRLDIATGIFTILAGGALWIVTWLLALNGGVYIVAWGPIVYGVVRLSRGLRARRQ